MCYYPAVVRVLTQKKPKRVPRHSTGVAWNAFKAIWTDEKARRGLNVLDSAPDGRPTTQEWVDFLHHPDGQRLKSFMRDHNGTSGAYFIGQRALSAEVGDNIYWDLWELAHMQMPNTLIYDDDVVAMLAAAQGFSQNDQNVLENSGGSPIGRRNEDVLSGFRKMITDRWIRFALTAPYMHQYGIYFPGANFTDGVARMEFLLKNPYWATRPELDVIEESQEFQLAYATMTADRRARRHPQTPALPPGGWFYPNMYGETSDTPLERRAIWRRRMVPRTPKKNPLFAARTF
jgi:hypothetical protein